MALKHLDKMSPRMKKALCGKCVITYRFSTAKSDSSSNDEKKPSIDESVKKSEGNGNG